MDTKLFVEGYNWVNAPENSEAVGVDDDGMLFVTPGHTVPDFVLSYIETANNRTKKFKIRHEMRKRAGLTIPESNDLNPRIKI